MSIIDQKVQAIESQPNIVTIMKKRVMISVKYSITVETDDRICSVNEGEMDDLRIIKV